MIGIGKSLFKSNVKVASGGGGGTDPDAQAFITAAGITDATQKSAVNQLVLDLKSALIWTKMKAIYPIVGGTATTHKYNLKDPRDLDAAYRLTFATGMTHSSTGMTGNGSSGYANTNFNINSYQNNNHISFYSRTNIDESANEMGAATAISVYVLGIGLRIGNTAYYQNHIANNFVSVSNTDSTGFYINSRTSSTLNKNYKNNIFQVSTTAATGGSINFNFFIGARNVAGTPTFYSTKQCAFASIGDGLTDTEAANFYTAVNAYQTTLGRNV